MVNAERDRLKPTRLPFEIQLWNIGDLESYVKAIQFGIERVEKLINEKNKVQSASNALFASRTDQVLAIKSLFFSWVWQWYHPLWHCK